MQSLYPVLSVESVADCQQFYVSLFGFETAFEIDWYVQLRSPRDENLQLAFVRSDHDSVPANFRQKPRGVVVTVQVSAVDPLYAKVKDAGYRVVLELSDEEWGQRHFMTVDPAGLLVDVVQMIPPTEAFLEANNLAS